MDESIQDDHINMNEAVYNDNVPINENIITYSNESTTSPDIQPCENETDVRNPILCDSNENINSTINEVSSVDSMECSDSGSKELDDIACKVDIKNSVPSSFDSIELNSDLAQLTIRESELTEEDNLHGLAIQDKVTVNGNASCERDNFDNNIHKNCNVETDGKHISGNATSSHDALTMQSFAETNVVGNRMLNKLPPDQKAVISPTFEIADSSNKEKFKAEADQQVHNLIQENLEKLSPKKVPVTVENVQNELENSNAGLNISLSHVQPKRLNPFNKVDSADFPDQSIWQMNTLPYYGTDVATSRLQSSTICTSPEHVPQHLSFNGNLPSGTESPNKHSLHIDSCFPTPPSSTDAQFDLMPAANRVRPMMSNSFDSGSGTEDIDAVIKEVKMKSASYRSSAQQLDDPWVKIEQPQDSQEITSTFTEQAENPWVKANQLQSTEAENTGVLASAGKDNSEKYLQPSFKSESTEKLSQQQSENSFVRPLVEAAGPCTAEELIEGIVFPAFYLGSTQLQSERNLRKNARMLQAQEAVGRIKAPHGESQPKVEIDVFVSTDKITILNTVTQEPMMEHNLRSISYVADVDDLVVIMAKRKSPHLENYEGDQIIRDTKPPRSHRVICHVMSSTHAKMMAQSIGQSFNVAYQQFLMKNGIEPQTLTKDDYNELLDMQEMYHDDLVHYSKQENVKDIWVEKRKGEPLGVVIVDSGWGSIIPTVILANLQHGGPAERCGTLSIGDQIMTINGTSLVGLPLPTCQSIIKGLRAQSIARLHIVSCPPVVTVLIKRPDIKYQLGFSVQDGIICSLMRGGIAERGGVRVGHRIIEINNQSVVATEHAKIVQTLQASVGEIQMKTMPAMMYRLLTGQEQPIYI